MIDKAVFILAGIPFIDDINGQKYFGNFETVVNGKIEKRDHYSIVFEIGGNCLYVLEDQLDSVKLFKKMGGSAEYYDLYPSLFYTM